MTTTMHGDGGGDGDSSGGSFGGGKRRWLGLTSRARLIRKLGGNASGRERRERLLQEERKGRDCSM